jgi:hypothetical protein
MTLLNVFEQVLDCIFGERSSIVKWGEQLVHAGLTPTPSYGVRKYSIKECLREVRATALHVAYTITLVVVSIRRGLLASERWPVHKVE